MIDADACPVKEEVYRVAFRREVPVAVVSNMRMRVPEHPLIERVLVSDKFDAADGITGGPAPFSKADRSRFLQALDEALVRLGRGA